MQVKLSMVPDAEAAPDAPEVRVGVTIVTAKGVADTPMQLTKEKPDMTVTLPVGGRAELTADLPPDEYDRDQYATKPGKWPEKAAKPEEAAAKPTPKSGYSEGGGAAKHDSEASSRKR